jgi:hypothetical protein
MMGTKTTPVILSSVHARSRPQFTFAKDLGWGNARADADTRQQTKQKLSNQPDVAAVSLDLPIVSPTTNAQTPNPEVRHG